jgi:hypothetical protein
MLLQGMVFSPAGIEVFKQHVPGKFLEAFVHGRAKISGGDSGTSIKANTAFELLPFTQNTWNNSFIVMATIFWVGKLVLLIFQFITASGLLTIT